MIDPAQFTGLNRAEASRRVRDLHTSLHALDGHLCDKDSRPNFVSLQTPEDSIKIHLEGEMGVAYPSVTLMHTKKSGKASYHQVGVRNISSRSQGITRDGVTGFHIGNGGFEYRDDGFYESKTYLTRMSTSRIGLERQRVIDTFA